MEANRDQYLNENAFAEMPFHFKNEAVLFDSYIKLIMNRPICIFILFFNTAHFMP